MICKNCEDGYVEIAHRNNPDTTESKVCDCCYGNWEECQRCADEYYENEGE